MKIGSIENQTLSFFLSDARQFRSVVELVSWFSRNSLKEAFSGLDVMLRFSVGEVSAVVALFDFTPRSSERNLLPLKTGEKVIISSNF